MKLLPIPIFSRLAGKIFGQKSDMWVSSRFGRFFTVHRGKGRNYFTHPTTCEEAKTRSRMAQASHAWAEWRPTDEERADFEKAFRRQLRAKNPKLSRRGYFISCEMKRLKHEGPLRAIPENNLQDWGTHR